MSTSFNGTSPQAPVRVATVSREQTPAEAVARQSHSDRPPVREQEAKPHARQGRRSVRMTLLLMVLIPLAVAAIFVPITIFSVATVSRQQMGDATGLTNLLRNLGGSVGISLLTNLVTRGTQAHQALMVGHLTPYDAPFRNQLAALQHYLARRGAGPVAAQHQAYGLMYQLLQQQAGLWAYIDLFRLLVLACAVLVPLVFLFKKGSQPLPKGTAMAH